MTQHDEDIPVFRSRRTGGEMARGTIISNPGELVRDHRNDMFTPLEPVGDGVADDAPAIQRMIDNGADLDALKRHLDVLIESDIWRRRNRRVPVYDFVAPKPDVRPGDMFEMHPSEHDARDFAIAPEADLSDFVPSVPRWLYPLLGAVALLIGWLAVPFLTSP